MPSAVPIRDTVLTVTEYLVVGGSKLPAAQGSTGATGVPSVDHPITVVLPPLKWSEPVRKAISKLPLRDQPREGTTVLDRAVLDLGRVDYIEQERAMRSAPEEQVGTTPLLFDLSRTTLIGYGLLPMLGALIKYRTEAGLITYLRLPTRHTADHPNSVIDYLQTWQFGSFLEDITGHGISHFLTRDSRDAWDAWTPEVSRYADSRPYGHDRIQVLSKNFVCLTQMNPGDVRDISTVGDVNERRYRAGQYASSQVAEWTTGIIGSLLQSRIRDRKNNPASNLVGSTILNELLINSLVHPTAARIYTYGQFCPPDKFSGDNRWYFVLSVWDDADGQKTLGPTLSAAFKRGTATNSAFGQVPETFHLWGEGRYVRSIEMSQLTTPRDLFRKLADAPFSATVPGVTSDPNAINASLHEVTDETDDVPADLQQFSGLGLYRVRRAAVRALGGFMEYAGSTLRTEIHAARLKDTQPLGASGISSDFENELQWNSYRIDSRLSKRECWPLAGNLWTVWLPASDERATEA